MQHYLGHFEQPFGLEDKVRVIPNGSLQWHFLDAIRHQRHVIGPAEVVLVEQVVVHGQFLAQITTLLEAIREGRRSGNSNTGNSCNDKDYFLEMSQATAIKLLMQ